MIELKPKYSDNFPEKNLVFYKKHKDYIFIAHGKMLSILKGGRFMVYYIQKSLIKDIIINDNLDIFSCCTKEQYIKKWKLKNENLCGEILYQNEDIIYKGLLQPKNITNKIIIYYYDKISKKYKIMI